MKRYRAWYEFGEWENRDGQDHKTVTAFVEEDGPVDTGLVDQYGVKIYSVRDRVKPGFHKK